MDEQDEKQGATNETDAEEKAAEIKPMEDKTSEPKKISLIRKNASTVEILDKFLKEPFSLLMNILEEVSLGNIFGAAAIFSVVFFMAYGLAMGFFGGWLPAFTSALKLPIIFFGAYLITLPSFYVFGALSGARFNPAQASVVLFIETAAASLILIGIAPVAWFFAASTGGAGFMTGLHITVIFIAVAFGLSRLWRSHAFLKCAGGSISGSSGLLCIWTIVYLFVLCQMFSFMGSLIEVGPFTSGERELFFTTFWNLF